MFSKLSIAFVAGLGLFCSGLAWGGEPVDASENESRFARLALDCVAREYPNKISHVLNGDGDVRPPRELHPAFYGCFDWHSAVHGHWLLVRLLRELPDGDLAHEITAALDANLTMENMRGEVAYFAREGTTSYERPYGLAWLFQLGTELREWDDPRADRWLETLMPLEVIASDRFKSWLPNLNYPVRIGTHNQSAFGMALALDWARTAGDVELEILLVTKVMEFHASDVNCPISYEPSGQDFLSPCLMEADLMRRVLPQDEYAEWFALFLPDVPHDGSAGWLMPGIVLDPTDGKLVHLDGVNLSRAWNLEAIALALPAEDERRASLLASAGVHAETGIGAVSGENYAGGHWLASFATYLMTRRALDAPEYRPLPECADEDDMPW